MDDGKCLLDVISDPQALKEFFRSPSQIGFVDSDISPVEVKEDEINSNEQKQGNDVQSIIKNDAPTTFNISQSSTSTNQIQHHHNTTQHSSNTVAGHGVKLPPQQTKPLAHFSFPTPSGLDLNPSTPFTPISTTSNGQILGTSNTNTLSSTVNVRYGTPNVPGQSSMPVVSNRSNSVHNTSQNHASSSSTSINFAGNSSSSSSTYVNTPLSFALGDTNKAGNILNSNQTHPVSSSSSPMTATTTSNTGNFGQHLLSQKPGLLNKQPSSKVVQSGSRPQVRTVSAKTSPSLAQIRPKKIVPRPSVQKNVPKVVVSDQATKIVGAGPAKGGQPLIAIQPKLIITSQGNAVNSGITGQAAAATMSAGNSNISMGARVQLSNQTINSLLLQQQKVAGIQNPSPAIQNKVPTGITNLVQLQPKQIAPRPVVEQTTASLNFQVGTTKPKTSQDQIQQQLLQNFLATKGQNVGGTQQFVLQSGGNINQLAKDSITTSSGKQGGSNVSIEKQEHQLKELLQRNQLLQQVIQVQRLQQQQQQQQRNLLSASGSQASTTVTQSQLGKKPLTQSSPLISLVNNRTLTGQQLQQKGPQTSVGAVNTLSAGTAINAKQLQQFLEKNPLVAQQLKQMNIKSAASSNVAGSINLNASSSTVSDAKNIVQLQRVMQQQQTNTPSSTTSISTAMPKKVTVISPGNQPQVASQTIAAATTVQPDPKVVTPSGQTQQKVLIVQQSNTVATPAGQPRVLLQTKEGRPILLTQEQFKQIQQQLASKNLTIQAKLVSTTTTAAQVVLKSSETTTTAKSTLKASTVTSTQVKQETAKAAKRPAKPAETEESKLIKRMKGAIQKDQNELGFIDMHTPFKSHEDVVKKLLPFHVFSEPEPNARMQKKANMLLDKLALQLTKKSDRMINKYRHLLLGDMQRDVPSAEIVMVNRIYLADEKAALMNEKKRVLEEARQMSQSLRNNESLTSGVIKQEPQTTVDDSSMETDDMDTNDANERALDFLLNPNPSTLDLDSGSPVGLTEPPHIDILDGSPSPMASANTFLSHLSATDSVVNHSLRTSLDQSYQLPS